MVQMTMGKDHKIKGEEVDVHLVSIVEEQVGIAGIKENPLPVHFNHQREAWFTGEIPVDQSGIVNQYRDLQFMCHRQPELSDREMMEPWDRVGGIPWISILYLHRATAQHRAILGSIHLIENDKIYPGYPVAGISFPA